MTSTDTAKRTATTQELDPAERRRLEQAFRIPRARVMVGLLIALAILVWSSVGAEFNFIKLGEGTVNMVEFLGRLFPPDFSNWARSSRC